MSSILKTNVWASLAACLAIALAAANAIAQQQQSDQSQSNRDQQQRSDDQNQQTRQSDAQSQQSSDQSSQDRQSQQSEQQQAQQRQRQQQDQQRQQQARQRDQQSRERDQSSWSESTSRSESAWPTPNRYESDSDSRQWSRQSSDQYRSDSSAERSRQGGLGVNIATDDREGVVVRNVHRGSPAEEMGIRPGDRITQVNGQEVNSTREFVQTIRNMDPGEDVELDIRRARGGEQTLRGELE
jgi:C-terminal processing protease CtpA/Prc